MMLVPEKEENLIRQIGKRPLIIYGMGYVGRLVADWCERRGLFYSFADRRAEEKQRETDKEVLLPENIGRAYPDAILVIASINYHDEIHRAARQLGFREEDILSCMRFWPKDLGWKEMEESANWEEVRQRAKIFSSWIPASAASVTDYGHERNFLREFLPEGREYFAPEYISMGEGGLEARFTPAMDVTTDAAFGMAILMSFSHPEEVIDHICAHTRDAVIVSYVPWELLPNIRFRRCIHYWNDYREEAFVREFEDRGFLLKRREPDPFDEVNMVYLFEGKKE